MGAETILIIGAATQAIGAISSASSQASASRYNAQVADRNAGIAAQQGEAQADQQRRINQMRLGTIQAGYGASGVASEGSPLDVLAASAAAAEMDVQTIKYNAALRGMGYSETAGLERASANNAETSGMYRAAGTLLTGAAQYKASGTGTPIPVMGNNGYLDAGTTPLMVG